MCLSPNHGAWLLGGLRYPSDLMREPYPSPYLFLWGLVVPSPSVL
jgi:hypothetical protein